MSTDIFQLQEAQQRKRRVSDTVDGPSLSPGERREGINSPSDVFVGQFRSCHVTVADNRPVQNEEYGRYLFSPSPAVVEGYRHRTAMHPGRMKHVIRKAFNPKGRALSRFTYHEQCK